MRFETLRCLRYLAKRGDWAFSFDLHDGYYVRLGLAGGHFATYSSYGRPFRRRMSRRKALGVCLLPSIDDFLFLAPSRQLALRLRAEIERVWGRLGLAKHPTKAHPEPTQ
eukprot:jgi/Tetstr1/455187/TSEL_042037.t1